MIRICFVCLGNICRSPTAEGIMLDLIKKKNLQDTIEVDSAGTAAYHVGEQADDRSRKTARERGIELPSHARQFILSDFDKFEYIIAMDNSNQHDLCALAPNQKATDKIHLLRSFTTAASSPNVPDPYYGGARGFDNVFDICDIGCIALLAHIQTNHKL